MIDRDEAETLLEGEAHLFTATDQDLGPVLRIYLDEYTGWPSFCTVASDVPDRETLVALHEAEHRTPGGGLTVPYDRARITGAPTVGVEQDLSISEEDALFDYYGVPIEGVVPRVEHLGSALLPTEHPHADQTDTRPGGAPPGVVEQDVERPAH